MLISELKENDLIIFGRSTSANGQYTTGWIKSIIPKVKGSAIVAVIALSERGRPPKPRGTTWKCNAKVIQAIVTTNNPSDSHKRTLTPIEVLLVKAKMRQLKMARKTKIEAWKTSLPKNRKGWWWKQVYPSSGENKSHGLDCLMRITRVNQKTISVEMVYKKNGVFDMNEPHTVYPGKMAGHKITIETNFKYRALDDLEQNNDTENPWSAKWDKLQKRRNELEM